jgi:DNA-binding transcriptional MerR regulator
MHQATEGNMADQLLTTGSAARIAGVSESTIRLWAVSGVLPSLVTRSGTRVYYTSDVERVARERAARPHSAAPVQARA